MVESKKSELNNQCLSVIMAAYNEISTIEAVIEKVLSKRLEGIDINLIIVESNSQDGTKELVSNYIEHPRVSVIFEHEAMGKGHAIRAGLKMAKGDFILIRKVGFGLTSLRS